MPNKKVTIKHDEAFNGSKAFPLVMEGVSYIASNIKGYDELSICGDTNAVIYALNSKREPVGCITFGAGEEDTPKAYTLFITLGYVKEEYRREGVYNKMYNALIKYAKSTGYKVIESGVHGDNKIMLEVVKKQNREVIGFWTKHRI